MGDVVEILMAVYNGAAFLPAQLDSILTQTDGHWHLTASDDGSDDGSAEILADYARRHPDKISVHRSGQRFGGARDHFFHLMANCPAEIMLFCDQDDVWRPDKVERMRAAFKDAAREHGPDIPTLVFSDQTPTDAALRPLADSLMRYQHQYFERFDYRSILMQNVVTGGAMGVNRALAELALRRKDLGPVRMHDWWLAAVAARFGHIVYIDAPLGIYRQHGDNAVGAKRVDGAAYIAGRLGALHAVRETILRKKAQAAAFRDTYRDRLDAGDLAFLDAFARPRSGAGFWLKYQGLIHGLQRKLGFLFLC